MTAANLAAHTLRCGGDSLAMHPDDVVTEVAGAGSDVAQSEIGHVFDTKSRSAKRKPVEHEQLGAPRLRRRGVRLLAAGAGLGLGGSVAL